MLMILCFVLCHQKNKRQQVEGWSVHHVIELTARKKDIEGYLEEIENAIIPVQESDILIVCCL